MSQCNMILRHMESGKSITPAQAYDLYGTLALHSRINELRSRGHAIDCQLVETDGGKVVGRYSLQKAAAQVADASFTTNRASSVGASKGEPPASAAPVPPSEYTVGQQYRMFGRRVLILADGISAYDGTRFTEVRDLGPWGG